MSLSNYYILQVHKHRTLKTLKFSAFGILQLIRLKRDMTGSIFPFSNKYHIGLTIVTMYQQVMVETWYMIGQTNVSYFSHVSNALSVLSAVQSAVAVSTHTIH